MGRGAYTKEGRVELFKKAGTWERNKKAYEDYMNWKENKPVDGKYYSLAEIIRKNGFEYPARFYQVIKAMKQVF